MESQMNKLVHQFILLPLAIRVLQLDKKNFSDFKMSNVYQSKMDSSITQLQQDLSSTKKLMYTQYHIDVKQIAQCSYRWSSRHDTGVITYTPGELKEMTRKVIEVYLYGSKSTAFEPRDQGW